MKKHIAWLLPILLAIFALTPVSTNAQSPNGVRADVPFDFIVGDKTFAAGRIIVNGQTGTATGPLSISNRDRNEHVLRMATPVMKNNTSEQAKLVFHKYGAQYFLAEVWIPGYKALAVAKSRSERALERERRTARNSKPEAVSVIAYTQ
jgi:hypothetical protein